MSASFLGGPTGFAYRKGQAGQNYGVSRRRIGNRIRHEKKIKDPTGLGSKLQRLGQSKEKSIKKKIKNPVGLGSKLQGLGQSKEKSILENTKEFVRSHKKGLIGTALGVGGLVGGYEFFDSALGIYVLSKYVNKLSGGRCNGGVYKREHRISGKDYVFKCEDKSNNEYEIKNEKWASKKLRNCKDKRIKAPIRYISDFSGNCWFVSEVAPGKSIEDYAVDISNCTYKEKLIKYLKIIRQFCQIQLVLFKNGVSHCDLNTGNWFINEENGEPVVYVIDFGRCYETKGECYIPSSQIFEIEKEIFGAAPFVSNEFVACDHNYAAGGKPRSFFYYLGSCREGREVIRLGTQELKLRNCMFGRLLDVLGFGNFNPSLSDNGCMDVQEIEKLFSDGKNGHLSKGDPELVRRFIDCLDRKISAISKMGDNVVENICPCTEVSSKNINDFISNEKLNCTNYGKKFNELCSKLGKKV